MATDMDTAQEKATTTKPFSFTASLALQFTTRRTAVRFRDYFSTIYCKSESLRVWGFLDELSPSSRNCSNL